MKGTSLHLQNMGIKQLCNCKVRDFAMALRARKVSGAFEKRPPGLELGILDLETSAHHEATAPPKIRMGAIYSRVLRYCILLVKLQL